MPQLLTVPAEPAADLAPSGCDFRYGAFCLGTADVRVGRPGARRGCCGNCEAVAVEVTEPAVPGEPPF